MGNNYSIEDVIEVITNSKNIITMDLMGIRTDINLLINPEFNKDAKKITENNDLLNILIKLLDKSFNLYIFNSTLTEVLLVDLKGSDVFLKECKTLTEDIVNLINLLDDFEELKTLPEEVIPDFISLKSSSEIGSILDKIILCVEMLKEGVKK